MKKETIKDLVILVLLLIIFFLVVPSNIIEIIDNIKTNNEQEKQEIKVGDEEKFDNLIKISFYQYEKMLEKENKGLFYVYVGRQGCSYCQKLEPVLIELQKIKRMNYYYLDTDTMNPIDFENIKNTSIAFKGEWGTPTLLKIKDGLVVEYLGGLRETETINNFFREVSYDLSEFDVLPYFMNK